MKKTTFTALAFIGLLGTAVSWSSTDNVMKTQSQARPEVSKNETKEQTYKIRYGLLSKNGTKILSGSHDVGSFLAENMTTGDVYDTYYSGGFQTLPQYYEGIPAGTYTFSAMQGQGGWTGYGSVVVTVSDAQVDADGYITVYIPITWEE
ncbi:MULTISPECIES: hypothetical protein [unclassified Chryseobacterium]|uniref:hypothetical protein n=1 Tax=unclassified Chryseobacterium TaxID=2593645 RepID=UPI001DBBEFBF|nr:MULTISPECIES: hypothetical protein [unclassified Chryseobacterium]MCQ9636089.1 hypothetical protein [Chryseobacterium sp. WG23]CAH0238449.1 hypothetical protein SRABI04_02916 [Chryseobacterium sp. Bi04]